MGIEPHYEGPTFVHQLGTKIVDLDIYVIGGEVISLAKSSEFEKYTSCEDGDEIIIISNSFKIWFGKHYLDLIIHGIIFFPRHYLGRSTCIKDIHIQTLFLGFSYES